MSNNECIVMLGTSINTKGGISSVIRSYMETDLFQRWNIIYIPTHIDGILMKKIFYAIRSLAQFIYLLLAKKIQLVHVHSASNASFYRKSIFILLSRCMRIKVVFHLHGGGFIQFYRENEGNISGKYIKFILLSVEKIIVLSEEWKKSLATIVGAEDIQVVNNPVGSATLLNLNRECIRGKILYLGLLSRDKGIYDLLYAVKDLKNRIPEIMLEIGGVGEFEKIRHMIKKFNLEKDVKILGWVDLKRKKELLSTASVFVLPSYYEGVPISILESLAVGLPVVSTNVGGIPSIIKNGVNGILIPPGDIAQLVDAILSILSDNNLAEKLSLNGKKIIIRRYLPEHSSKKISMIYQELLNIN